MACCSVPILLVMCPSSVMRSAWIREIFPLNPKGIIEYLNLRRPIYKKTAAYGHFGRTDEDFTWERTDKADALRAYAKR